MYRGFQLRPGNFDPSANKSDGEQIYNAFKDGIRPVLEDYVLPEGTLNGTKMQSQWFPKVDCDIFISHAHNDKQLAVNLAGWLFEKFEILAFVDSCIWGQADELLRKIDDKHCRNETTETYNYTKRNRSTAHVHMMLNNALNKMIDQCECLFFLNTPTSTITDIIGSKTESPWIYSEISQSQIIRKNIPKRTSATRLVENFAGTKLYSANEKKALKVEYFLQLNHLANLTQTDLERWDESWNGLSRSRLSHSLDNLYRIKPVRKP